MNWKKAVGFGMLLWIFMFVVVSIFIAFKIYGFVWTEAATAIIAGIISFILAGYAKPKTYGAAAGYAASWLIVGLILDFLVTTRFNPNFFISWSLWLGYGLAFIAPFLQVRKSQAGSGSRV